MQQLIDWLEFQVGRDYVWGSKQPPTYDCSGLTKAAFHQIGITLPDGSANQAKLARQIAPKDAHSGCLVFKRNAFGKVVHVGIVVTGPFPGRFCVIEAKGVAYGVVKGPYWANKWSSAVKIDRLYQ